MRVATLLAKGMTYQEVADHLGVSRRTIDWHSMKIRKKINGFDRADIVIFAIKKGYVKI